MESSEAGGSGWEEVVKVHDDPPKGKKNIEAPAPPKDRTSEAIVSALSIALYDGPELGPADVVAGVAVICIIINSKAKETIDNIELAYTIIGALIQQTSQNSSDDGQSSTAQETIEANRAKAQDNSHKEKHGDRGRFKSKKERQIEQLEQQLQNAKSKKEREYIKNKIKNIKRNGEKKEKGEEHSRVHKR